MEFEFEFEFEFELELKFSFHLLNMFLGVLHVMSNLIVEKTSINITETITQTITHSQLQENNSLKWPGSNNWYKVSVCFKLIM